MSIFIENSWATDKVGDKLSQELFRQKTKKAKYNNRNDKITTHERKESRKIRIKKNLLVLKKNDKNHNKKLKIKNRFNDNNVVIENKNACDNSSNVDNSNTKIKNNPIKNKINKKRFTENIVKNLNENKGIKLQKISLSPITKSKKRQIKKKEKQLLESKVLIKNGSNNKDAISNVKFSKKIDIKKIKQLLINKDTESGNKKLIKNRNSKVENSGLSLRERMMTQLKSSRFRYLNETLYNNESTQSFKMFKEDPESFKAYHDGYQSQVKQWPLNPLDTIIDAVKKMPKDYIIADFGCGEAKLASLVGQKVHSLDLVAMNDRVTACDMARTPLLTNSINVVIFCLSLMGSNLEDYILEANRVLKKGGILKIADVESRFNSINEFVNSLKSYGFENTWKDLSHNLFYFMDFKKITDANRKNKNLHQVKLKSCLYKKR